MRDVDAAIEHRDADAVACHGLAAERGPEGGRIDRRETGVERRPVGLLLEHCTHAGQRPQAGQRIVVRVLPGKRHCDAVERPSVALCHRRARQRRLEVSEAAVSVCDMNINLSGESIQ